jgi:hypothetical protein
MFGIDNTGVINQRQSPAIWQSDIADFPANYILGRILIDTFQGGIYIDTASTRLQISNGSNTFVNGIKSYGGIPTNQNIGLGGDMVQDTTILLQGFVIDFTGTQTNFSISSTGVISSDLGTYLPISDIGLTGLIPNTTLQFKNVETGDVYYVAAQLNP